MTPAEPDTGPGRPPVFEVSALAAQIRRTQQADGAIAWWPGHQTDPWDHVESAMGLTVGGLMEQARRAYQWLARRQLRDGSWYTAYFSGRPVDRTRQTHHAAYIAVGLYHYHLAGGDAAFIHRLWPVVDRAIEFTLRRQAPGGEIYWALSPRGQVDKMALLTGCSSICLALRCGLRLAGLAGTKRSRWRSALGKLEACIIHHPQHFNMTKARFAMDWFYPVLCGVIKGGPAHERITAQWKKFVIENMGVRCVSDQPWVTIAESCELVLALDAMGRRALAGMLFDWIAERRFTDHTFWCGFTVPDMTVWPTEKISWTNAAVLLAADALYDLTPAAGLFRHAHWGDGVAE